MKKHWLTAIIMAALLLVQAVVICGGALAEGEEHEHTWGEWEGHGTCHERHCTAEGCEEVQKDDHDVPCTICGYGVQPEHTFSDEWSYDEVDHWHACTEEGCNWTKDQAEHEWSEWEGHGTYHERHCTVCEKTERENHELPDGKCDKCGYTMHGAKNEWKYDETNQWHGCLFEGCTEKLGEAKHNFVNGVCECGYKQQINNPVKDEEVTPVIPAPMPPQTGDASWLAVGIGMIAAAVCIALRKKQSN